MLSNLSPRGPRAFTLLEVMVAIALLAVGMTVLLQVQTRSVQMAMQAREMTVATMLARGKLLDCQTDFLKKGFSIGDYSESGSFDEEGYPTFYWECHAYKPDMPVPSAGDITGALSAGAGDEAASAADEQGAAGMGMLAPLFSQVASLLGDSIRELHVIVRYGEGADQEEMTVTTHVIDKTSVNSFATMVAGMCQTPGGGGGGGGGDGGGEPTRRSGAPGVPGGAPRPGVGGLPGGARPGLAPGQSQAFEGLRAGDFIDKMPVDVQQGLAIVRLVDKMALPELVKQGLRDGGRGHGSWFGVSTA